jgi:hypothetical protein
MGGISAEEGLSLVGFGDSGGGSKIWGVGGEMGSAPWCLPFVRALGSRVEAKVGLEGVDAGVCVGVVGAEFME